MNRKDIVASEKQQQAPIAKRQNFWEKYGFAPLAFVMRNPKLTPVFLFALATVPLAITAFVLTLFFPWH